MKICHILFSFTVGGTENLLIDITSEQAKSSKVSIIIINNLYNHDLLNRIHPKVKVFLINRPESNKWNLIFIYKIWKILFELNPKVIHCHYSKAILFVLPFISRCVLTIHSVGDPLKYIKLYRKVFSISLAVKSDIKDRAGLDSSLIYNGVNFREFSRRSNYALNGTPIFKIVQISRLVHEHKGQDLLIQALKEVISKYGIHNIHLDLIGDGPSLHHLQNLIKVNNLEKHITTFGVKDRSWIYENLCKYHLLVQPSRYEGFGLTVVEAVAAGLPVVASNVDGLKEILKGIPSAFLFENQNEKDLSENIANLISMYYDDSIEAKCQSSYVIMKDNYNIKKTGENYLKCY